MRAAVAVAVLVCAALQPRVVQAKGAAARLYLSLDKVVAAPSAPAEITEKSRALFQEIVGARPEVVSKPGSGVSSYSVSLNINEFQRSLGPRTDPAQKGQMLTIKVGVSLVGTTGSSGLLALSGNGQGTVMAEVGDTIRPREEEQTVDAALREALTHALDEAVSRLAKPIKTKPKAKPKK